MSRIMETPLTCTVRKITCARINAVLIEIFKIIKLGYAFSFQEHTAETITKCGKVMLLAYTTNATYQG
jgi:hypothetical protein